MRWLIPALAVGAFASPALAHTSERGIVMLLPTGYYMAGGALAVAASFLVLMFLPQSLVRTWAARRDMAVDRVATPTTAASAVACGFLVFLLLAGWIGNTDPLRNPLPLTVWTLWWIGLTLAQAVLGDVWAVLNPWRAPYRMLRWLLARFAGMTDPPWAYPASAGYWPAVAGFLGFAWFELVDLAPDNPSRLALVTAAYTGVTLIAMALFGERAWLERGECFSVFFGLVARLSPLAWTAPDPTHPGRWRLRLDFPGAALIRFEPLPASGVLFVLLTLATVSFDGLNKTFWWLGLGGINPLEFPGRSAVMTRNSVGLLMAWATLAALYGLTVALGARLARRGPALANDLGAFALSILPISLGYHAAHYLTVLLVNGQYAVLAFNDPLGQGWNLFGLAGQYPKVSFLSDFHTVAVIWAAQAACIVLGHIVAVLIAHLITIDRCRDARAAVVSQLPLAAVMVAYTWFGLWLLATPIAG
ncbi:MAG: hypothetical protein FJX52_01045 [Alphaproteobacteria bacterium]|nr:hypothetical protein [Alphaproteobacteria bacterium]